MIKTRRSFKIKVDGPEFKNGAVLKSKRWRSKGQKLDGISGWKTFNESRRPDGLEVNRPKINILMAIMMKSERSKNRTVRRFWIQKDGHFRKFHYEEFR